MMEKTAQPVRAASADIKNQLADVMPYAGSIPADRTIALAVTAGVAVGNTLSVLFPVICLYISIAERRGVAWAVGTDAETVGRSAVGVVFAAVAETDFGAMSVNAAAFAG